MQALLIEYPRIDPVLFQIGPIAIRWYALSYIAGLLLAWRYIRYVMEDPKIFGNGPAMTQEQLDDLLFWSAMGVIIGGRLGYVLFYGIPYNTAYYLEQPWKVFATWEGGMSFHGGGIGIILAVIYFCRRNKLDIFRTGDLISAATPIGLFFGRIANFINGELWGRPTDLPWAMVFPTAPDALPRHPSQLYEAGLEGILLFVILRIAITHFKVLHYRGMLTGIYLAGYGVFRFIVEFARDSDTRIFSPDSWFTMGMLLSFPMWAGAAWLIYNALQTETKKP